MGFYGSYPQVDTEIQASTGVVNTVEALNEDLGVMEKLNRRFKFGVKRFDLVKFLGFAFSIQLMNAAIDSGLVLLTNILSYEIFGKAISQEDMIEFYSLSSLAIFCMTLFLYISHCFCPSNIESI